MTAPTEAELIKRIGRALIDCIPTDFLDAFCVVEQAPRQPQGRFKYVLGSENFPDRNQEVPSSEIHDAVCAVARRWQLEGHAFPGLEVEARKQPDGKWLTRARLLGDPDVPLDEAAEEEAVQEVLGFRQGLITEKLGPMPGLEELPHLSTVWPGGGLLHFTSTNLEIAGGACSTWGLTNRDLPTPLRPLNMRETREGNTLSATFELQSRTPRFINHRYPGYGYELVVLTPRPARWPLLPLRWFVDKELVDDLGLRDLVQEHDGVMTPDLDVGGGVMESFLVSEAREPLPGRFFLPHGGAALLVATRITAAEVEFGKKHGLAELLERLVSAGVGVVSDLKRASVV